MHNRRCHIALLYGRSLYAAGIESRLRSYPELDVQRVDAGRDDALGQLKELQPDVILVDLDDAAQEVSITVSGILTEMPDVPVVGLDLRSDEIHIYQQEKRIVKTPAMLMETLFSMLSLEDEGDASSVDD